MDEFGVSGHELIRRTATEHGNGAHVYVPKDWLGTNLAIIRTSKTDTNGGIAALVKDPFGATPSPHTLTIGDQGSGRDYSVNRRVLRWGASSETRSVIICDFHGGRSKLIEAVGGEHVVVDNSETINPLNIAKPDDSEINTPNVDAFHQKKDDVVQLLSQILRIQDTDPTEYRSTIEAIVARTYKEAGVTRDPATHSRASPTMGDFFETARTIEESEKRNGSSSSGSGDARPKSSERERESVSQLMYNLIGFTEGGKYDYLHGQSSLSLEEGGVTYFDLSAFENASRGEQAVIAQAMLNHLNQIIKTFLDESVVAIENSHVLGESAAMMDSLEKNARHWHHYDAGFWFLTDSPEYLTIGKSVTERPTLIDQCQAVEFFASGLGNDTAATFGLSEAQAEFLRSEAKTGAANGEYSEGLVSQSDVSGWTRFTAQSSPIEDRVLVEDEEGSTESL